MAEKIVNLTVPIVIEEIELVLDESESQLHRQLFLIPDLHQELVAYVLSHVRNRYGVVDTNDGSGMVKPLTICLEERLKIHDLAFQGIHSILQLHRDLLDRPRSLSPSAVGWSKAEPVGWAG